MNDEHDVKRLENLVACVKRYVERFQESADPTVIENEELIEFGKKITLWEVQIGRPLAVETPKIKEETKQEPAAIQETTDLRKQLFSERVSESIKNQGDKVMKEQLEHMKEEQERLKNDLSDMVGTLKRRALGINENIQNDTAQIENVNKKADENLTYLSKMSTRLNITINSSSLNCKLFAIGVVIVLALWVLAYLIMRIFPKAGPPRAKAEL